MLERKTILRLRNAFRNARSDNLVSSTGYTGGRKDEKAEGVEMLNQLSLQASFGQTVASKDPVRKALRLYGSARARAWLGKVQSRVTGSSRRLLSLETVRSSCAVSGSHYAGLRQVALDQVRGSEGRVDDFDGDMMPVDGRSKGRWLSVARARQEGVALPPVELIQVADVYFVRDGHHRISVARALGEEYIAAEVTVWQVSGPLPWEHAGAARELALQPA
jgi:hypothetical protein